MTNHEHPNEAERAANRKRRNQRIAAIAGGIAVFIAVASILTGVVAVTGGETSVVSGADVAGPAETGPAEIPAETGPAAASDTGWDGVTPSLPPEGTALSTPVEGQPIRHDASYHHFLVVYADGRVLWWHALRSPLLGWGDYVVERRLTPEGLDLVRSGAITAADLAPPAALHGVPESAWADAEARPYAPPRYSVCLWGDDEAPVPSAVDLLPAPAKALLRGLDPDPLHPGCLVVSTEEAHAFYGILWEAGLPGGHGVGGVTTGTVAASFVLRNHVTIYLRLLWPDGDWHDQYKA